MRKAEFDSMEMYYMLFHVWLIILIVVKDQLIRSRCEEFVPDSQQQMVKRFSQWCNDGSRFGMPLLGLFKETHQPHVKHNHYYI